MIGIAYTLLALHAAQAAETAEPQKTRPKFTEKRTTESACAVNEQVPVKGGDFYMGSQFYFGDKLMTAHPPDGASPRKKKKVGDFYIDQHTVTNKQFDCFVKETQYVTETEEFGWSFVFEPLASETAVAEADHPETGLGRVKDSPHWLGVKGASYRHPHGPDSSIDELGSHPVVQVSHRDASDYCKWAGAKLPSEKEWEYAARGGQLNMSYGWGNTFEPNRMNIWEGEFPSGNTLDDGFLGTCPVDTYGPNQYGVFNMLGNVWEWVSGGKADQRIQRGGGFVDTKEGKTNHAVMTSTRQIISGDSTANTQGFRCASKGGRQAPIEPPPRPAVENILEEIAEEATNMINLDL